MAQRVSLWDRLLAGTRSYLRDEGMREVTTPLLNPAVAVEPHIEPVAAGGGYLTPSPELAMKRLLCHGSGSIFQIAASFRGDERGPLHRPEFRLVEWYREGGALDDVMADVEALVDAARGATNAAELSWRRVSLLEQMGRDLEIPLRGNETAAELAIVSARVSAWGGGALGPRGDPVDPVDPVDDDEPAILAAWTELWSMWVAWKFDPWLRENTNCGVHLIDFPAPLAALAQVDGGRALRFESYAGGVELANGYLELLDAVEQRRRFDVVNRMRSRSGTKQLPLDAAFLSDLDNPGLPPCAGVAMGLDRLAMVATGASSIDEITLLPS